MRVHYLQHVPFEGPGAIERWARAGGHDLRAVRLHAGEPPPEPDVYDALVVLGGPMSVDDEDRHPFLAAEKRAVGRAIDAGKAVLGICLGAQLVARVLGARVAPAAHEEIGWFAVELTDEAARSPLFAGVPRRFETFHWHGDAFEIPPGAVRAASSEACANQAFVYGNHVVGVQFHPEVTAQGVDLMLQHEGCEVEAGAFVQTPDEIRANARSFAENARVVAAVLGNLTRGVA